MNAQPVVWVLGAARSFNSYRPQLVQGQQRCSGESEPPRLCPDSPGAEASARGEPQPGPAQLTASQPFSPCPPGACYARECLESLETPVVLFALSYFSFNGVGRLPFLCF